MSHLFVLSGFVTPWEVIATQLRSKLRPHEVEFYGRDRPKNWPSRRYEYRDLLTKDLVKKLFGTEGAVSFCSKSGACALGTGKWTRASCRRDVSEKTRCRRQRPDMLIFVCSEEFYPYLFEKFGRCALFVRLPDENSATSAIGSAIESALPSIRSIKDYLINLSNTKFAPKIPMENFQNRAGCPIARDAQQDLTKFRGVMDEYHLRLYLHSFVNKKKPYMRGAYMFNEKVGFQRDRLHKTAHLGGESRQNGYHLLNAFHMYGLAVTPGWHFDVTRAGGGAIRQKFLDSLTGRTSALGDEHVNITPCDRLV